MRVVVDSFHRHEGLATAAQKCENQRLECWSKLSRDGAHRRFTAQESLKLAQLIEQRAGFDWTEFFVTQAHLESGGAANCSAGRLFPKTSGSKLLLWRTSGMEATLFPAVRLHGVATHLVEQYTEISPRQHMYSTT